MQYLVQPALGLGFRQSLRRRRAYDLPGGNMLWLAAAKVAFVALAVVFCLNLWLGYAVSRVNDSVQTIEAGRHELKNDEIILLAERATLMSEKQVREKAGEKLALFVPATKQVFQLR